MNVLILSVTAGYGHHSAANAVSNALEQRGATVQTVDVFKYLSKPLYDTVDKGYSISTKYIPKPYGQLYSALEKNQVLRRHIISGLATELLATKFSRYFEEFKPDVIVCSHVFAAMLMDELTDSGKLTVPVVAILTDYTFHPFWDDIPHVEYIVTGSKYLDYKAKLKGIEQKRIYPLGIPIHPRFLNSVPKREAREQFGLDPDKFTILFMSGSMGYGNMVKSVQALDNMDEDIQLLCVCGRNEKIYEKLSGMTFKKNIKVFGFVDNGDIMMDAADCLITKPGGLSTTESMTKGLPMILVNPIPGQEERNSEFFVNSGAAVRVTRDYPVDEAVHMLYHFPERLAAMKDAMKAILPENGTAAIADLILGLDKK